jgi:thioesterase domain-containing protein
MQLPNQTIERLSLEAPTRPLPTGIPPETLLQNFILKVWQKLLGKSEIGIDDDFIETGGDRQLRNKMILAVENATRKKIPIALIQDRCTIRGIESVMLHAATELVEFETIVKEGSGTPLLFCHGDYATHGLYVRKLAEMLICDQPVLLLHPYPNPEPALTIEEMARAYIPDILKRYPGGPLQLVGYCNGGQLAWEIAVQLKHAGREIQFIILIETISVNARLIPRALARLVRSAVAVVPRVLGEKLERDVMNFVWSRISHRQLSTPYTQALQNYVPPRLSVPVITVVSEESRTKAVFSPTPWEKLASRVDYRFIGGTHRNDLTILVSELVPVLNELLK